MHPDFDEDVLYYTWQFLRLNSEYQKMYDKYVAGEHTLLELHKRWGLRSYPDWRDEDPDILPEIFFEKISNFGIFSYNSITRENVIAEEISTLQPDNPNEPRYLLVAFDMKNLTPKDYLDFQKEVFCLKEQMKVKVTKSVKRNRLDKKRLDTIIATYKVYLRNPKASTYEIAKKLPKFYEITETNKPSRHHKTVSNNLQMAKKLIEQAPLLDLDFKRKRRSK